MLLEAARVIPVRVQIAFRVERLQRVFRELLVQFPGETRIFHVLLIKVNVINLGVLSWHLERFLNIGLDKPPTLLRKVGALLGHDKLPKQIMNGVLGFTTCQNLEHEQVLMHLG